MRTSWLARPLARRGRQREHLYGTRYVLDLVRPDVDEPFINWLETQQRIERLPFTAVHGRLALIAGLGALFDAADLANVSSILPSASAEFGLAPARRSERPG